MPSFGTLHRVVLVRIAVSEALVASAIRVKRIGELGTEAHCKEIELGTP
jgi:hypothetical protein